MNASSLSVKVGAPLPYTLRAVQGEDGRFIQHAVVACCDCSATASAPWQRGEAPKAICGLFERRGWVIYQAKTRCPDCGAKRKRQQATFAKLKEDQMISSSSRPAPQLVKAEKPEPPALPAPSSGPSARKVYLLTIDEHGGVSLTPANGATEMLFGDVAYLVIPAPAAQ